MVRAVAELNGVSYGKISRMPQEAGTQLRPCGGKPGR
jgi:hypothetical protein